MSLLLRVLTLPHGEGLPLPAYQSEQAAGFDLRAAVRDAMVVDPRERAVVPTGLVFELPQGYEAQVRPRSGLAMKHGVTVLNSPGTIDADYRGEVKVMLINLGGEKFLVERGDRVAQAIIAPVTRVGIAPAKTLGDTVRGSGGFGSTG